MGTETDRGGKGEKIPLKKSGRIWNNGNSSKVLGIARCGAHGLCFYNAIPYHPTLPPTSPLPPTFSHLARAVLNPGTLTFCQTWCNRRQSCPAEACGCRFKSSFVSVKTPLNTSLHLPLKPTLVSDDLMGVTGLNLRLYLRRYKIEDADVRKL